MDLTARQNEIKKELELIKVHKAFFSICYSTIIFIFTTILMASQPTGDYGIFWFFLLTVDSFLIVYIAKAIKERRGIRDLVACVFCYIFLVASISMHVIHFGAFLHSFEAWS